MVNVVLLVFLFLGEPQHRAILNSYFSLCSCVVFTLVTSAFLNDKLKFELEHIQVILHNIQFGAIPGFKSIVVVPECIDGSLTKSPEYYSYSHRHFVKDCNVFLVNLECHPFRRCRYWSVCRSDH